MPLDSVCLKAVTEELICSLTDAKIDKVQMPERDEIILSMHTRQDSFKLLISAGTGDARIHITRAEFENPQTPPMFCMLLRKHLTGAVVERIEQIPDERAVMLILNAQDALGDRVKKTLVCELMGKYSNIILLDSDNMIIDCLRRVDITMSEKRQVLPGLTYLVPPRQDKLSLFENADFALSVGKRSDKWLLDTFCGISPLAAREIAFASCGETDSVTENDDDLKCAFSAYTDAIQNSRFVPVMLSEQDGKPEDFYCFNIRQYGNLLKAETYSEFSELLDTFYDKRSRHERMKQRTQSLTKQIKNARDRTARKLVLQGEELKSTYNRERLRQYGDIVSANMYSMKRGMTVLKAQDFYSADGKECEIPLDPAKSPQQNAAKFYKDYAKAKNAEKNLTEQIVKGENELEYLNSVLEEIERAEGERDISEIRDELEATGYLKRQKNTKGRKPVKFAPMRFISSTGAEIRVGRNNTQNDALTLKNSSKTDVWLHTQKIHGSHVVISTFGREPDETTLLEAACLAALNSKASDSKNVPVDYTLVKYVKKPNGAKPGMVTYTDYKTIFVTPDKSLPKKLGGKRG